MVENRMLVADADSQVWEQFRLALGDSWTVVGAASVDAAMAKVEKEPFSVAIANFSLPKGGGANLLNKIRAARPETLRFIAAEEAIKEKVISDISGGGHQFLSIPFDKTTLKSTIERTLKADYGMSNAMRELLGRIRTFPTIPSLYLEVVNALRDRNATTVEIGAIIAKDMAMTTKLVQVLNSAYFGLPRKVTDPTEAIGILGFETVKSLIMTVKLLSQYDKVKPVYFSIDNIWRHSTNVARTAKVMALLETGNTDVSGMAYTAGLMHDLGKVILAANFDTQYHSAHSLARKQQIPLWVVEKDIFGASHGEIGAYMLALWGMPDEVVRAAAMHHSPLRSGDKNFTALTEVHVANALEHENTPDTDGLPAPAIDTAYLQSVGLEDRVELWRDAQRDPDATRAETTSQRANATAITAQPEAGPNKFGPVPLPPKPVVVREFWKWLGIGVGVTATLVFMARIELMRLEKLVDVTRRQEAIESQAVIDQNTPTIAAPVKSIPVTQPAAPPLSHPSREASAAPAPTAFDAIKLQAIFFSSQHPSALINGRMASINQNVDECKVLAIGPTSVTLAYQDQRRTLTLP